MVYAGCDLGIVSAQAVIIENDRIVAQESLSYKNLPRQAAEAVMERALFSAGLSPKDIESCFATGFGRRSVPFADDVILDAGCLQRALLEINPEIRTVIDVGGHTLQAFAMNDRGVIRENVSLQRCVTGTGLFLEVMARALGAPLEELIESSLSSDDPTPVTSQCVVMAESEVITRVNEGKKKHDIFAGVQSFIGLRILSSVRKMKVREKVAFVGGVAMNDFNRNNLERRLDVKFAGLGDCSPMTVSAFGAALLARERI